MLSIWSKRWVNDNFVNGGSHLNQSSSRTKPSFNNVTGSVRIDVGRVRNLVFQTFYPLKKKSSKKRFKEKNSCVSSVLAILVH